MKKILCIMLCLCIFSAFLPAGASSGNAVIEISGESSLIKPPQGVTSKVLYDARLLVDDVDIESDFIYSTDSDTVKTDAEGYVYLTADSDDFTLTVTSAQYPEAKKSINIKTEKGYYDNFESYEINSVPENWLNNAVVTQEDGNKIVVVSSWNSRLLSSTPLYKGTSGKVTASFSYRITSASAADATGLQFGATSEYGAFIDIKLDEATSGKMLYSNQNGNRTDIALLEYGKWYDIDCVMNFGSKTYNLIIDGKTVAENFAFDGEVMVFDRMFTGRGKSFDEYMLFSGEKIVESLGTVVIEGSANIYKPLNNSIAKVKYNASLSVDGKGIKSDFLWYSDNNDIEVTEDGYVILDKNTPCGTYEIGAVSTVNADYFATTSVTVLDGVLAAGNGNWNYNVAFATGVNNLSNKQVTFEIQMTPHNSTTHLVNVGQSQNWGTYLDYSVESGNIVETSVAAGTKTVLCPFVCDVSQNYRFQYDMVKEKYDFYVDGEKMAANRPIPVSDMRNIGGKLWFKQSVQTEIAYYSGVNADIKEISGADVVNIPTKGKTTTILYSLGNYNNTFNGDFFLKESYAGVSIASDGNLTVSDEAEEGEYTIYATLDSYEYEKTITLVKAEKTLLLKGADTIFITPESGEISESYEVVYSSGEVVEAQYFVYPEGESVSVSSDGTVSVSKNTPEGTYLIIAKAEGKSLKKQFDVSRFSIKINGSDSVEFYDKKVQAYYKADTYECSYTLTPKNKGVTITAGGILNVSPDAEAGIYKIEATMISDNGFKGEKEIEIIKSEATLKGCIVENDILKISGYPEGVYDIEITATDYYGAPQDYYCRAEADSNGNAEYNLSDLPEGFYLIEVNGYFVTYASKGEKLLETDKESNRFYLALSDMYGLDLDTVEKAKEAYIALDNKSDAVKICGTNPGDFAQAILISAFTSKEEADFNLADELKKSLEAREINTEAIDLLLESHNFKETVKVISYDDVSSVSDALDEIREKAVLKGIQHLANYREAKKFIALCGSEKYNKASEEVKNNIAMAIAGKEYFSFADVLQAIDNISVSVTPSYGGGGGGSSSGKGSSGGGYGSSAPAGKTTSMGTFTSYTYSDVSADFWGYSYIESLSEKGIINGYNGYFNPNKEVTRAEFVKMLCSAFDIPTETVEEFFDVQSSEWFAPYIGGAFKYGYIKGENGKFRPNDSITREDAAVIAFRFIHEKVLESKATEFTDSKDISEYAKNAVNILSGAKIINGFTDGSFKPKAGTTRAEAAKIIYEIMKAVGRL